MLDCPFCGNDYSEIGLDAGRCRVCGGVVAWQDEGLAAEGLAEEGLGDGLPAQESNPSEYGLPAQESNPSEYGLPAQEPDPPQAIHPTQNLGIDSDVAPPPVNQTWNLPASDTAPTPTNQGTDGPPTQPPADEPRAKTTTPDSPPSPSDPPEGEGPSPHGTKPSLIEPLTDSAVDRLDSLWRNTYAPAARPGSTLQQTVRPGVDTKLVIQQRDVGELTNVGQGADLASRVDYQLLRIVGKGGVGIVYTARQASIDRDVAVKMLQPEMAANRDQCEKFLSEAVVTGELEHPNIVPIYDLGRNRSGDLFYSMKYVRGTPWCDKLTRMSLPENLEVLLKVADAIAFAHSRSVVHRDIKPENVMLGDFGEVLVLDWGIAVSTSSEFKSGLLGETGLGGTPVYMAPEMATGPASAIGMRSDVYLLGAVLFEILTGDPPHAGSSVRECLQAAAANKIRSTQVSGELMDIAMKAMSTRSTDRYIDVLEFQRAIRTSLSHSESIRISDQAKSHLVEAEATGEYDRFAQAIFGFEQASDLWEGNEAAVHGAAETRLAYAERALLNEDFDLGISQLDDSNPKHKGLLRKLAAGREERAQRQQRVATLRRAVAALMLAILVSSTVAVIVFSNQAASLRVSQNTAIKEAIRAGKSEKATKKQKEAAEFARGQAVQSAERAEQLSKEAMAAQARANMEADNARAQESIAHRTAYRLAMGLAPQQLQQFDFGKARATLEGEETSVRRKLRHFEWARLQYLATQLDSTFPTTPAGEQGSGASITSVDSSRDGRVFIAGTRTGQVLLWRRGQLQPTAIAVGGPVHAVALSQDARTLVAGFGSAGDVGVWDLSQNQQDEPAMRRFRPHGKQVNHTVFSPRGQSVLSCSADGTAMVWNHRTGQVTHTLRGHLRGVNDAAFSTDENWIVTASDDSTVRVWHLGGTSVEEVERFQAHQGPVYCVEFSPTQSPSGFQVVSGGESELLLWNSSAMQVVSAAKSLNVAAGEVFMQLLVHKIQNKSSGVVATSGVALPLAERLKPLASWNPRVVPFDGHRSAILDVGFVGDQLVSAGQDSTIRIWNTRQGIANEQRLMKTLAGHGSTVAALTLPKGRPGEIISGSFDRTVRHWRVAEYEWVRTVGEESKSAATASALSDDGQRLLVAHEDGVAKLYDMATGELVNLLDEGHEYLTYNAIYYDEGNRVLTIAGDSQVIAWDTQRGIELGRLQNTGYRGVAQLSINEKTLVTGSDSNTAVLWDLTAGTKKADLLVQEIESRRQQLLGAVSRRPGETDTDFKVRVHQLLPDVASVAFTLDDRHVVIGDTLGRCWICDAANGETLGQFQAHDQTVNTLTFFKDDQGPVLLSASDDRSVAAWRLTENADGSVSSKDVPDARQIHPRAVNLLRTSKNSDGSISIFSVCAEPRREGEAKDQRMMQARHWKWGESMLSHVLSVPADRINSMDIEYDDNRPLLLLTCVEKGKTQLRQWDPEGGNKSDILWNDKRSRGLITTSLFNQPQPGVLTVGGSGARRWTRKLGEKMLSFRPHSALTDTGFLPPNLSVEKREDDVLVLRPAEGDSPRPTLLYTASVDGSVKIWRVRRDDPEQRAEGLWRLEGVETDDANLRGHRGGILSVAVSTIDGKLVLLTASQDRTAKLWSQSDDGQWKVLRTLAGHSAAVRQAMFLPGGKSILTVSDDHRGLIWPLAGDDAPRPFDSQPADGVGHDGPILCAAVSRDGQWIATGGDDRTIQIWSAAGTGPLRHVATLEGHSQPVRGLKFSNDRRRLFSVAADQLANVWNLDALHRITSDDGAASNDFSDQIELLLTLKEQTASLTSVTLSRDGRWAVATGENGATYAWETVELPPALLVPENYLEYNTLAEGSTASPGRMRVAEHAIVSAPTSANFESRKLIVQMKSPDPKWQEELRLESSGRLREDNGEVFYQPLGTDDPIVIGKITSPVSDRLEIELTASADNFALEALLHHVSYLCGEMIQGDEARMLQFGLYDQEDQVIGNYDPEQRLIYLVAPKE